MKTDDVFHGITTLVYSSLPAERAQGTGFFYQQLGPEDPEKAGQPQWRSIENTWVVTNRHVLLPEVDGVETVPDSFTWHLRRMDAEKICWEPIVINSTELRKRALFHPNPAVDVGVVSVLDLITDRIRGDDQYLQWYAVHGDQHPGKNKITVEVGDEALVIGYPREYYDNVNLFPIVKSGVVASRWGDNFDGEPFFLVDARLFPGSSGSIVVTRPQNFVIEDGTLLLNKEKQFAFLGIYSGEPLFEEVPVEVADLTIIRRQGFDLGIVWYGTLVDEIIGSNISADEALAVHQLGLSERGRRTRRWTGARIASFLT